MSVDKIDLVGSLKMLLTLVAVFGVYKLMAMIFLLIVGATANVATSGDITIPTGINTSLTETVTSVGTGFTAINAGDTIILGLIGLVVILKLFWPLIAPYIAGSSKGKNRKEYM